MTKLTLNDIKKKVEKLATKIGAPPKALPTYGYSIDDAHPHIEIDEDGWFHYVIVERGQERDRKTIFDLDILLYWIFSAVTHSMATKYELNNRMEDQDSRRIWFRKQEELLGILSDGWRQKKIEEHNRILENYPFDDLASLRATYYGQLRKLGYSESECDRLAYEKYPENKK